jgi:universal stress protein A
VDTSVGPDTSLFPNQNQDIYSHVTPFYLETSYNRPVRSFSVLAGVLPFLLAFFVPAAGTIYGYSLPITGWLTSDSALILSSNRKVMSQTEKLRQIGQAVPDTNISSQGSSCALITHVLAPTDLSDESRKTLDYAVRLAEHFHARLTLVHVWTTPTSHAGVLGALDPETIQRSKERAEFILRSLQDIIRERHSDTESCFLTGEPCSQIVAVAKSSAVDLIVISTQDYDWLTRMVEGSDAEKILRHATCPVWIVRDVANSTATPGTEVK